MPHLRLLYRCRVRWRRLGRLGHVQRAATNLHRSRLGKRCLEKAQSVDAKENRSERRASQVLVERAGWTSVGSLVRGRDGRYEVRADDTMRVCSKATGRT